MAALFQEISLGGTLGVTFLGVCVSSMCVSFIHTHRLYALMRGQRRLYGVTCLQTFTYYRSLKAKTDGWLLRSLVRSLALRRIWGHSADMLLISEGCRAAVSGFLTGEHHKTLDSD